MSINIQKFLPLSSSSSAIVKSVRGGISPLKNVTSNPNQIVKKSSETLDDDIKFVNIRLINIDKILKKNLLLQEKELKNQKKEDEKEKFDEKEQELEKKEERKKINLPFSIPSMGIFDRINRFITFTLLGWVVNKLFKHLPALLEFSKNIAPVIDFVEKFVGNVFNGFVNFIDLGYKAYDTIKNYAKQIGGEPFQKVFDDFTKNLNTFVNLAIIAGVAATGGTDFGLGRKPSPTVGGDKRPRITTSGGRQVERPDIKSALRKRPKVTTSGGRAFGKIGKKLGGKVFGRIPIIGGLVNFLFSLWSGEPIGRAAAKGVGAAIGGALGTFIPVPGVGTILGGILGDIVGGALYDTLIGSRPGKPEIKAKKTGGKVTTRKGKVVGGAIRRTLRKTLPSPKVKPIIPGASIGGEKEVQKIFPEPQGNQLGKTVNPFGFVKSTTESMGQVPFLGPLFSLFGKVLLGQRPDKDDYSNIGLGVNAWINNAIGRGILKGNIVQGFNQGGLIDFETEMRQNISGWVEKSVEQLVKNKVTEAINELRKNIGMEPLSGQAGVPGPSPEPGDVSVSGGNSDFWTLVAVASREDADSQGQADVAQSIYNRLASGAYTGKTIRELILARNQYQPTWDYPNGPKIGPGIPNPEWTAIKDAESAAAASGFDVNTIKKVASNILNPNLQKNARDFIQGRTDFKAQNQGVTGISRSNRGNVFGWHYNYRKNKIASVPNFGATVITKPGGGIDIKMGEGKGNLKLAQELAKSMGLTMTSGLRGPRYPGDKSLHISGRAMDFSNDSVGNGTPEQLKFAQEMAKRYGTSLKQLIYTPLGYGISDGKVVPLSFWGSATNNQHYNHVHVAFKEGGVVPDNNSIKPSKKTPNIKPLQSQTSYEESTETIMIIQPIIVEKVVSTGKSKKSINFSGGGVNNSSKISQLSIR